MVQNYLTKKLQLKCVRCVAPLLPIFGKLDLRGLLYSGDARVPATRNRFAFYATNVRKDCKTQHLRDPTGFICSHRFAVQRLMINTQC